MTTKPKPDVAAAPEAAKAEKPVKAPAAPKAAKAEKPAAAPKAAKAPKAEKPAAAPKAAKPASEAETGETVTGEAAKKPGKKDKRKAKRKDKKNKEAVIIRFDDAQLPLIDASAEALGLSRAAWVRMVVAQALTKG